MTNASTRATQGQSAQGQAAQGQSAQGQATGHDALSLEVRSDGVAVLWIDVPGQALNTLGKSFIPRLHELCLELESRPYVCGVVIASRKPDNFLAGADLTMLEGVRSAAEGTELAQSAQGAMSRLAQLRKPVVAAVHGSCLGGGLELALACHGRVASDSSKTKLGLPEVQLGILPGAGGTQRLSRLLELPQALDLLLTGKQVSSAQAKKLGLVDEVVSPAIVVEVAAQRALAAARDATGKQPAGKKPAAIRPGKASDWLRTLQHDWQQLQSWAMSDTALGRKLLFEQARKRLLRKTHGHYPAPERILQVVKHGLEHGLEAGLQAEAKAFGELLQTPQSRQLMGIFRAQTALKKDNGVDDRAVRGLPIERVGVLGAGLMGAGIAYVSAAKAGVFVRLRDRDQASVLRGLAAVRAPLERDVRRRKLSSRAAEEAMAHVTATTDWQGFADLPLIIEAVFEDLPLKQQLLRQLDDVGHAKQIFASNTSSLPIGKLASASRHPEQVIGMHYFSPVEKMPLLEIIVTEKTAPWVIATCVEFGKRQGKTVIVVRDGAGFYTTRILAPLLTEAAHILAEGVAIERIDAALVDFGFPVGPIKLTDEVGIDVANKVCRVVEEAFGERMAAPPSLQKLVEAKRLGRKSGSGFYRYDASAKRGVDPEVYRLLGVKPTNRKLRDEDIAGRCVLAMVNETVRCFEEGIVRSARDADIGAVMGLGFPPFLGGPLRWIDAQGVPQVLRRLESYQASLGPRFAPAPLLRSMAEQRRSFYTESADSSAVVQPGGHGVSSSEASSEPRLSNGQTQQARA